MVSLTKAQGFSRNCEGLVWSNLPYIARVRWFDKATHIGPFAVSCTRAPQRCGAWRHRKVCVGKASSKILAGCGLLQFDWSQADPLKSPATRSTCSSCIMARLVRRSFFPIPRFLKQLLLWRDMTGNDFWPLRGCRRKAAFDTTPCVSPVGKLWCRGDRLKRPSCPRRRFLLNKIAHPP